MSNLQERSRLIALGLSILVSSLGTSIANVGLPSLGLAFGATVPQVQWVVLAYLLAVTSLVVGAGRLGDRTGRRRLLVAGIALFGAASLACGAAPSLGVLVAARALQGIGAAVMMALSLAMVGAAVPRERTGSALGLLGTMSALGTAVGPVLGGALISLFGWRALFLVLAPCAALALPFARRLPDDAPSAGASRAPFDAAGTLLLALALSAYALAMTTGRGGAVLLGIAAAGLGAFAAVEARAVAPLVPLALLRDPVLVGALLGSTLVMTVLMATLVVGPFYLTGALGLATGTAGLVMAVGPIVTAAAGPPAGRLVDRFGEPAMVGLGLAGIAAGCLALAVTPASGGALAYACGVAGMTSGYALFQAANQTAVLKHAPAEDRGVLSGLLSLSRNLGLVSGASLMGAVFARGGGASAGPAATAAGFHATFAVAFLLVGLAGALLAGSRALAGRRLTGRAVHTPS